MTSNHDGRRMACASRDRRGVLLLLVLSVLTLFLLMGTVAVLTATRARQTSLAFATATAGVENRAIVARALTTEALLVLIRGSKNAAINEMLGNDSLLKDMYGTNANGVFVDEAYDAFDDENPFLTHIAVDADGRVVETLRSAWAVGPRAHDPAVVDNDGDSVADGIWLPPLPDEGDEAIEFLPPVQLKGRNYQFRVSYLVLDLDGRINVNTHGRPSGDVRSVSSPAGPADLDGRNVVGNTAWALQLGTTNEGPLPYFDDGDVSPDVQWRQPMNLWNQGVDGRFGASGITKTYDLRLDLEAQRPSMLIESLMQNPFTLGELERVLRQHDRDASTLPPRLEAILGDRAERARMRVTTDSWGPSGDRVDINWVAPNSGVVYERQFHTTLNERIKQVVPAHAHGRLSQWLANVVDFRDVDNANTNFGSGVRGAEADKDAAGQIPGVWNAGYFLSYAHLLGVPQGTGAQVKSAVSAVPTIPLPSLVIEFPQILEAVMTPSPFTATTTADPRREPGRVNVNTCDDEVWKVLIGQNVPNPFAPPHAPATNLGEMLMDVTLVFNGDPTYDVRSVNHEAANRLANVATVRSSVFAVWITLEIADSSPNSDPPSYHRLFAIVDRSIPVDFVEGRDTNVRDTIRLVRFLN